MLKSKIYLLFLLTFVFSVTLVAQKTIKVCGEYTCRAPENMSLEQAKIFVLEQAKLAALAEEFGTNITQLNTTVVKNENGKSDISYLSLGGSDVKGEWLEDIKIEYGKPYYEQDMLVLSVSVCGKARKITGAGIDFLAKVLCNGTEAKYESENFKHGDDIYLLFRSPVDVYLAVYLVDNSEKAYCLLPYMNETLGKAKAKAGKDCIFFSAKHAEPTEKAFVNEYTMTCDKATEQNFLYIIVSPNEFTKANDIAGNETLPRELPFADFQKWLAKNRQKDRDMKVEIKSLMIKK